MPRFEDARILLIDKPAGLTSAGVIAKLKKRLNIKKIGHAGTLDPMATGLLVCMLNAATRMAHYAEAGEKTYSGEILFGRTTDSEDVTGETVSESEVNLLAEDTMKQLLSLVPSYKGDITQTPPSVSAVKVNGKRAYALARNGVEVELKSRSVHVSDFSLEVRDRNRAKFVISCSKGTYIRSIARDLGRDLGCGACLHTLRREASYPFAVTKAVELDEATLEDAISWEQLFPDVPYVKLPQQSVSAILSGSTAELARINNYIVQSPEKSMVLYGGADEKPVGLLVQTDNSWKIGVNIPCQV